MVLSMIILAISLSLDALGVGLAYGIRKIRVPLAPRLIICFFSIIYSGSALVVGKALSTVLLPQISKLIGVIILLLIGIWIIIQAILKNDENNIPDINLSDGSKTLLEIAIRSFGITIRVVKNPIEGDVDKSGVIDISEAFLLGFALSVDAIGVGIGSALAGFYSMLLPLIVGLFQLFCLCVGLFIGNKFASVGKINKKFISLLPGILLICLAIIRI